MWSSPSNRHQDLAHGVAKSLQPSPLDHRFSNALKYGNSRHSGAGMMIGDPIAILHLDAFARTTAHPNWDRSDSTARSEIYSLASRLCRSV